MNCMTLFRMKCGCNSKVLKHIVVCQRESLLIERGVSPESVIFVESGKVEITVPGEDKSLHLAVAGPGKVFGLRAVVAAGPPEITVRCMEECIIAEVSREQFLNVVRDYPKALVTVVTCLNTA